MFLKPSHIMPGTAFKSRLMETADGTEAERLVHPFAGWVRKCNAAIYVPNALQPQDFDQLAKHLPAQSVSRRLWREING